VGSISSTRADNRVRCHGRVDGRTGGGYAAGMYHLLLVALGGAVGSALRHLVNLSALRLAGPGFPFGTLAVNLTGSFAMGVLVELIARRFGASNELRLFLMTGVLGGFTTFSAFSLDTAVLWERGA